MQRRITLDDFLVMYKDVPEYHDILFKTSKKRRIDANGNILQPNSLLSASEGCMHGGRTKSSRPRKSMRSWKQVRRWACSRKTSSKKNGVSSDGLETPPSWSSPSTTGSTEQMLLLSGTSDPCTFNSPRQVNNPVKKLMKGVGRVLVKHFYFMSVAVESTGGAYRTHVEGPNNSIRLEYCYTSSYAFTSCNLFY